MQRIATFNYRQEIPKNTYGFRAMLAKDAAGIDPAMLSFSTYSRHLPAIVMCRTPKVLKFSKCLDSLRVCRHFPEIMPSDFIPMAIDASDIDLVAQKIARSGLAWYVKPDKFFARGDLVHRIEPKGKSICISTYEDSQIIPREHLPEFLSGLAARAAAGNAGLLLQREVEHYGEVRVLLQKYEGFLVPQYMYMKEKNGIGCNVAKGARVREYYDKALEGYATGIINMLIREYAGELTIAKAEFVKLFATVAVDFMVSRRGYFFCEYNTGPGMEGVKALAPRTFRNIMLTYLYNIELCLEGISRMGEDAFYTHAFSGKELPT
ncbi:MAG: hypothetical protein N3H30_00235 [Candidatus Micrarchaeota archaeon]|nr:hypothetical protein [Candidatus Micrarchaeota archaeon]